MRGTLGVALCCFALVLGAMSFAGEVAPRRLQQPRPGVELGVYSERTIVVGVEVDRDDAQVLSFTLKPRPYVTAIEPPGVRLHDDGPTVQLEVVLLGPDGSQHSRRIDAGPLCLVHDGGSDPHVAGDTIRTHRDAVVFELPELPGFDRIELAYFERDHGATTRRSLGVRSLSSERFSPAGGSIGYSDLAFAEPGADPPPVPTASTAMWPEDFDDPDLYHVFGDESEGARRINIVLAPDGYTYAQKALMESHASSMVAHFRNKTPYAQHDPFINYTLVYAYSLDSGTDQCDCDVVLDTAMGTRFPQSNPQCGHSDNRCLYYGSGCDGSGTSNITEAELRAPYRDETIVLVNTTRYGGCGGARAVYSAANGSAVEVAVHELGHSFGGLADEYSYNASCGVSAGEINTSRHAIDGAWPEWISDLGPPREGAQYYQQCLYRPQNACEMRSLNQPFCAVCNQHWSLVTYGHPRVSPTAPIESQTPDATVLAWTGVPLDFEVGTRLSTGAVTHQFTWWASGPLGDAVVGTGGPQHTHVFDSPGISTLTVEVIADSNFVKRSKDGPNVDLATWQVQVRELLVPPEVSAPGSPEPLRFLDAQTIAWEDAASSGAFAYNVYRGDLPPRPAEYGACLEPGVETNSTTVAQSPGAGQAWFYLIAGVNPLGEGPLGQASSGAPRNSATPCD